MFRCGCRLHGINLVVGCLDSRSFYSRYHLERCCPRSRSARVPCPTLRYVLMPSTSILTHLSILKISMDEVTLMPRKLPMIQIYIPHNLPTLCNILDGRKPILSASQWYVRRLIFSTPLINILGWRHCRSVHFTISPPC
jgi:hypothetical protein